MIWSVRRVSSVLLLALALPGALRAAIYVPTKTADTNDGVCDADCSLREAVTAANQHPGEDAILLHAGVYTLSATGPAAGNLAIQGDLVLLGDGAGGTVIDGGAAGTILSIPANVAVHLQDLTLRNGRSAGAGGAIHNNGDLTLERTILTGNASVAGAAGAGVGGAILSDGVSPSLTVRDSTIYGNTAQGPGGGIAAGGNVTLANVTVSGNHSTADLGGGLYFFTNIRATINNASILYNTAAVKGGGLLVETAVFVGIAPKITNSILAFNSAPVGPDCAGGIESSYNFLGTFAGCTGPSAANHDQQGAASLKVEPLAQNGGPTPTHALASGSPAIDGGNPAPPGTGSGACEATDQRGVSRPAGAACDVGAFEASSDCVAGGADLCLSGGRFKVTADWQTATADGAGTAVTLTADSGYFWFFDPGNVEVVVKVLDGCSLNNHYWVYAAGITDQRVDLTVTDTQSGQTKTYTNPLGTTFKTITDTGAFATCP